MNKYARFGAMIATSTVVMFGLMYLNTYSLNHVTFSETRVYMAFIMGATMAIIMLLYMLGMYYNRNVNIGILVASAAVFALSLWLVRSQRTVEDMSWMRAMIPHHSIAILTSERAAITDPRVRKLADQIIESQRKEIDEMKSLIEDIEESGVAVILQVPEPDAEAAEVPEGYRVEVFLKNLTYPTSAEFDGEGNLFVAEAGYSYGEDKVEPRLLKISPDGRIEILEASESLRGPVNDLLWHDGRLYISHRGKISVLEDGSVRDLVAGLPSDGDHQNNQLSVGPDGKIYFGQGTASNSGVVGKDNLKMGWLGKHPRFHDVPARDIRLCGQEFTTKSLLSADKEPARTGAFQPFGHTNQITIQGKTKAGGTILRMNKDGTGLEVYAWGLRNPYGLAWGADGTLFASENGFDVRGSRPIANDKEDLYQIKEGAWYGWPDFASGIPVTDPQFRPKDGPAPEFLIAEHPPVEKPWMTFPKHSSATKLAVSQSGAFGKGQIFLAFFGHMSPMTGNVEDHGGHRVVRIDPTSQKSEVFFTKKGHGRSGDSHGSSSHAKPGDQHREEKAKHGDNQKSHGGGDESVSAGPRRLMDVVFSKTGDALYIVDFGSMIVKTSAMPIRNTGLIWRVSRKDARLSNQPKGNLTVPSLTNIIEGTSE